MGQLMRFINQDLRVNYLNAIKRKCPSLKYNIFHIKFCYHNTLQMCSTLLYKKTLGEYFIIGQIPKDKLYWFQWQYNIKFIDYQIYVDIKVQIK